MYIEFISSLYLKCEDDELESNFFRTEYSFRYIMSWGHTEKNCKFKVGFNGVVTYYSVLLWNNKYLLGQCGCLILIVTVIDAT